MCGIENKNRFDIFLEFFGQQRRKNDFLYFYSFLKNIDFYENKL